MPDTAAEVLVIAAFLDGHVGDGHGILCLPETGQVACKCGTAYTYQAVA
jgi:hypothetical protein